MNLSLEFNERKFLLIGLDIALGGVSVLLAGKMWEVWGGLVVGYSYFISHAEWFLLVLLWFLLAAASGIYEIQVASSLRATCRALIVASCVTLMIYFGVYFFSPPGSLPRFVVLGQIFSLATLVGMWRGAFLLLMHAPVFTLQVIVVGAGLTGRRIVQVAKESRSFPYFLVGFVDDDREKQGQSFLGVPVLGTSESLSTLCRNHRISEVIFAIIREIQPSLFRALQTCQEQGIRITPMSVVYEELTGRVPLEHVGRSNWPVVLPIHHPQTRTLYLFLKRLMDLLVAMIGLILFGPLLPFLALAILIDSKGPIFYRQARVGRGGRIFQLIKLRTMFSGAELDGMRTTHQDPRITRVGRFLRVAMLDEAPQFWNVLKGEISFVGPRPEQPELVADLERSIPFYGLRHSVKPGMAGWALIHQGQIHSPEEAAIRLEYDLYYIKHQSLWLDLLIILRTIGKAFTLRRGEVVVQS